MHQRIQNLVIGKYFAGLEVQFLGDAVAMHLVVLKRNGQQLVVEKSVSDLDSVEKLSGHLAKDIPLAIAFTGKGILHRRIAADPNIDLKNLLSKVLPNASLKEFYMQTVPAAHDEQFVSVLRKTSLDAILDQIRQKQIPVVECSIGPLPVVNILSLLDESKSELGFAHHKIHLQNGLVEEVNYDEQAFEKNSFNIGGQKVEAESLVAFSAAFQHLLSPSQRVDAQVESLLCAKDDFLQRKLFKAGGKAFLIATLALLLGNYFFFSHYWSEKNILESKLQTDGGAFTDLRKFEKQVQLKRAFLEQAGLLGHSNNSYYADQIAYGLPREILLTRMALAPRLKLSQDDSIGFKPGRVEIDGSCTQSVVLNEWLKQLKEKKWVKGATLESYVQDKTMKQGEFEIALELE